MEFIKSLENLLTAGAIACVIVLMAMIIDLAAGLHKAKINGQMRSSWALKRSVSKFISYIGSMLIAIGIDVLLNLSHIYRLAGLGELRGVPLVSSLIAIFLLCVEILSIRESATLKERKRQEEVLRFLRELLGGEAKEAKSDLN